MPYSVHIILLKKMLNYCIRKTILSGDPFIQETFIRFKLRILRHSIILT